MRRLLRQWRWLLAEAIDRALPGPRCWADLAGWAIDGTRFGSDRRGLPPLGRARGRGCKAEGAQPDGSCWCGKYRARGTQRNGEWAGGDR